MIIGTSRRHLLFRPYLRCAVSCSHGRTPQRAAHCSYVAAILATQGSGSSIISDNETIRVADMPAFETIDQGQLFVSEDIRRDIPDSHLVTSVSPSDMRSMISAPPDLRRSR